MSKPVIFGVNPRDKACGIAQFGLNLEAVLKHSERYDYQFREPVTEIEYRMLLDEYQPVFVLWNYYPCTMPWLNLNVLNMARSRGLKQASIFHEVPVTGFDALIYPDPTFKPKSENLVDWFPIGRPIPKIRGDIPAMMRDLNHPIIGSSGFGFENKGYVRLVEQVNQEFEHATIRFHLPYARWGDEHGERARRVADWCRNAAKPSIKLEFSHDFKTPDEYIEWLAGNDLNAFLYDEMPGRGIASTIDFALMANRPIAVTKTTMFRHLHDIHPSICVEDRSLREIMSDGVFPLMQTQLAFSPEHFCAEMDFIMDSLLRPSKACRLLRDSDRTALQPVIAEMHEKLPEMMARKISEANVQQAWTVEMVRRTGAHSVLCVGCFEDTGFELLIQDEPKRFLTGIDSAYGTTLRQHREKNGRNGIQFQCVFATSVIEHVPDDSQFIRDLCDSLIPGGTCILTADFKEGWKKGQPLPATDQRFYTSADIARIEKILTEKGCYFVDKPDTSGAPDFHYQGHDYSFIGLIFKKL
jgi:hypothetical protein